MQPIDSAYQLHKVLCNHMQHTSP